MPNTKPLPTPTGRVEFYSFMLASLAKKVKEAYWDPIISWIPPKISERKLSSDEFYIVYGRSPPTTHCSTTDNPLLSMLLRDSGLFYQGVWINTKRAKRMGIKIGDRVVLESVETGEKTEGIAFVTDLIREDTVFTVSAFGQESDKLTYILKGLPSFNKLLPLQFDPLSGCTLAHEIIVKVKKA